MNLYKYTIELKSDKKVEAKIQTYNLTIETESQYVYNDNNKYYFILDKKNYLGKDATKGNFYYEGSKTLDIKPYFYAYLFTKTLSKAKEKRIKELLTKAVSEKFGFLDSLSNVDLENVEFEEVK